MRTWVRSLVKLAVLLCVAISVARGQTSLPEIQTRLLHKPLFLRGFWQEDKLRFNAKGELLSPSGAGPFTVSGMEVESVQLAADGMHVRGHCMALVFEKTSVKRIPLRVRTGGLFKTTKEVAIDIEVQSPADGDYSASLDRIFAPDVASLIPTLPDFWQEYALEHFAGKPHEKALKVDYESGKVSRPKVVYEPEPAFSEYARAMRKSGNVLLSFDVNTSGRAEKVEILFPVGFGLDETAVDAARAYRFEPAMEDGKPVSVRINVEVNFRIY